MGQPSIQVRANYLGKTPFTDPHYHLLIVVDDGNNNKTYYRGGPESNVSLSDATRGTTGSGRSSGTGNGGKLITESGRYVRGGTDYDPDARVIYQAPVDPRDVSKIKDSLANQMYAINSAKINYFPTGPNSNSTAGTALRNLGISIQIPKGMWIPGFEQQLVDQNGRKLALADVGGSGVENARTNSDSDMALNAKYNLNNRGATISEANSSKYQVVNNSGSDSLRVVALLIDDIEKATEKVNEDRLKIYQKMDDVVKGGIDILKENLKAVNGDRGQSASMLEGMANVYKKESHKYTGELRKEALIIADDLQKSAADIRQGISVLSTTQANIENNSATVAQNHNGYVELYNSLSENGNVGTFTENYKLLSQEQQKIAIEAYTFSMVSDGKAPAAVAQEVESIKRESLQPGKDLAVEKTQRELT